MMCIRAYVYRDRGMLELELLQRLLVDRYMCVYMCMAVYCYVYDVYVCICVLRSRHVRAGAACIGCCQIGMCMYICMCVYIRPFIVMKTK
jgi:hypothetical protein